MSSQDRDRSLRQLASAATLCLFLTAAASGAQAPRSGIKQAEGVTCGADRNGQESLDAVMQDLERAVRDHEMLAIASGSDSVDRLAARRGDGLPTPVTQDGPEDWQDDFLTDNPQVRFWEDYFSGPGQMRFSAALDRLGPFRSRAENILEQAGVPGDLIVVALVESDFVSTAVSSQGATGAWQFMPATAIRYGLFRDAWRDDRTDMEKSTFAAARYLADLHRLFGDWLLALAAYNAGEERVLDAIEQGKSHDFWALSQLRLLPRETRDYVPQILGALRAWRQDLPATATRQSSRNQPLQSSLTQRRVYALTSSD
jgi:hypothetical protein